MRVTSAIFYLTALVSGINAQDDTLGTFTTFTDLDCSTGGEETTILDKYDSGLVSRNARALKANVQSGNCKLVLWVSIGVPQKIGQNDDTCYWFQGREPEWQVSCDDEYN